RHHRVQQREQPLERGERGSGRGGVARVQPRLDRLRIPVAEVVEDEVVERLDQVREVEAREQLLDLRPRLVDAAQDPDLLERLRGELRFRTAAVLKDQPRDVPQLVRELLTLLELVPRETRVLLRGHLEKAVARRV